MSILKTLAIIGAGDLGLQIAHYAIIDNHYQKVVFIDDFAKVTEVRGIKIIGKTADIEKLYEQNIFDELIIGIGYMHLNKRKEIYNKYKNIIPFGCLVHSTSWVDATAKVNKGCVIFPNCSIDMNVIINGNTILNNGCTIAHDSSIGSHSFISPRVVIAGFVKVSEQCIIGSNSTVINNIFITEKVQIGAGTVVINNIDKEGLYVGNPQRFIR